MILILEKTILHFNKIAHWNTEIRTRVHPYGKEKTNKNKTQNTRAHEQTNKRAHERPTTRAHEHTSTVAKLKLLNLLANSQLPRWATTHCLEVLALYC